ncbi:MAG: HD-GYP domain-containing protein [Armatimonadota bacterium]|nr:HD-GYP domain-containing protein [Armatimonadota bacterium]
MALEQQWRVGRIVLVGAGGISLGFGLSGLAEFDLALAGFLLVLALAGEWLEVRLRPLGSFTLRPVVAFIGLWIAGPTLLMFAGLLPILIIGFLTKRASLPGLLSIAGRDSLCFWLAFVAYRGTLGFRNLPWEMTAGSAVAAQLAGLASFWIAQVPLQAVELYLREGIQFRAVLRHLVQHTWVHAVALVLAALALSYLETNFGLVVMGIAVIMLVETYYPWKLLGEQDGILLASIQMMAQAVDLKDPYTSKHSQRVSQFSVRLARAMGLGEDEVERIRIGALMHDIGKIGISGRIIRKPSKLTAEEHAIMREHPLVSADIIGPLEILGESAEMVRHHHENWDGTGYPNGLKGEEIPLGSRIIFVADALDALVTHRPYRMGVPLAEALAIIKKNAGTQFDPAVVEALGRIPESVLIAIVADPTSAAQL